MQYVNDPLIPPGNHTSDEHLICATKITKSFKLSWFLRNKDNYSEFRAVLIILKNKLFSV